MTQSFQVCAKCIMDTTIPSINFDDQGVCNFCREYDMLVHKYVHYDSVGQKQLETLVEEIKGRGTGRDYDCILGVSGGVDSTYAAYLAKTRFGLHPLAVHLDNGWDAELAVNNIEQTLKRLDVDLYTYVLDWEEFRDLQVSFLKSSIANAEIPTDHAITAILYQVAAEKKVSYIINGMNIVTEAIMPASWMYTSTDLRLIKAIHSKFGTIPLRRYPQLSVPRLAYYTLVKRIRMLYLLNYVPYVKEEAKLTLSEELGWRDYGGKHQESLYTRFFQSCFLPRKFNIDKRKPHLSSLIWSGQITRKVAIEEMKKLPCSASQVEEDIQYVKKKLRLSDQEFEAIMTAPPKSFVDYPNNAFVRRNLAPVIRLARRVHYGNAI